MNAPDTAHFAANVGAGQFDARIAQLADAVESKLISWRRDLHAHPELGNRETRTGGIVAEHLRKLGFDEVRDKVAFTGVVGVLKGGKPGPAVALRADMDGLPVTEEVDVPFASKVRTTWNGTDTGVMHACGHDAHTSILMAVAEVLAGMRKEIPGTVVFIFQPAEEMPPDGEEGGAALMIKEGCLANPKPEAIFGLHITSLMQSNQIGFRPGPAMASADKFKIFVQGTQTHGAMPWRGVDPIVVGSQIVLGLQTIVSRKMDLTKEPSVVTVGMFKGGLRQNIIPDNVEMEGTIRSYDETQRGEIHEFVKKISTLIAESGGAKASVHIHRGYDVTYNDEKLTERSVPHLTRVAGEGNVNLISKLCGAEDFSCYQQVIPGFFYFMGCTPKDKDARYAAPNHSPRFFVDESGLKLGVKTLAGLALDYLASAVQPTMR